MGARPLLVAVLALVSCGPRQQTLEFYPTAGDEHFTCFGAWGRVGTTQSIVRPRDFRALASNLSLLTARGAVPFSLIQTQTQRASTGLLDFEEGGDLCDLGTPALAYTLVGEVDDDGPFMGLEFTLGASPSLTREGLPGTEGLFDEVTGRARGLSVALKTSRNPLWRFHLVDDCTSGTCSAPRLRVEGVDPTKTILFFDLLELVSEANVDAPPGLGDTAAGCGTTADDEDCPPLMRALGNGAPQRVLRASPYAVGSIDHAAHAGH